ncbi:MAG: DUF3108 domain-containing protein [Acidobacteriaceae bacterium]|nr:DUF3108 domain-containing protein [Acidobacteriaceae bacterium]
MRRFLEISMPLLLFAVSAASADTKETSSGSPRPAAGYFGLRNSKYSNQANGVPEVAEQLRDITVDPKEVADSQAVPAKVRSPKPAVDLTEGVYKYNAKIGMGDQGVALKMATIVRHENGAWTVTEMMETPSGAATDITILERGTLILKKRTLNQGTAEVNLEFTDDRASGSLDLNGRERPIAVQLGGPVFADAAGAQQVIGCLPLAPGYSAKFRNFDIQKQKEKLMQLTVTGQESVTVPAGTFDAYRVELTSADGGPDKATLWIARDSRKAVKMTAVLPQMSGATLTTELLQ